LVRNRIAPPGACGMIARDLVVPVLLGLLLWGAGVGLVWWWL
jgi:hypothetical protein